MQARILEWSKRGMVNNGNKDYETLMKEIEAVREESFKRDQAQHKEERITLLLQKIPLRFRNKTFEDYQIDNQHQSQVKALAIKYVETFNERLKGGTNLIFSGKPGTGKTLLSLIIYQALLKLDYTVRYESSTEFLKNLLDMKFKSQSNFQNVFEMFGLTSLLIIDESTESINKEGKLSAMEKQLFFQVINMRYERKLSTILISNRGKEEMQERLGVSLFERILEAGIFLGFSWGSYRVKKVN